ncbi:MAG: DUF429 domain-containing protein [Desulfocapsaceae bacterium]|nr:DUF429 domain-containing protein [Desulfocapsaceae bacterium]
MILAGVDLAWQSNKNSSALAFGKLIGKTLVVEKILPAVAGIDDVINSINCYEQLTGVAIDASLIINNPSGQRPCERQIGQVYGGRGASCHTTNTRLYPNSMSVYLSQKLLINGFAHLFGKRWQIECYPHPAIIEIFALPKRLRYKRGRVSEKRNGQKQLAKLLLQLTWSNTLQFDFSKIDPAPLSTSNINELRGKGLKTNEDVLDALVCLYIAGLYGLGQNGRIFGDTATGYVWIPVGPCV